MRVRLSNKTTKHHLIGLAVAAAACPTQAQEQAAPAATLATVEVVGTTPLPGTDVPKDQMPANVQTADASALRQLQSLNLPDFMASQLPSVNVNEIAGQSRSRWT